MRVTSPSVLAAAFAVAVLAVAPRFALADSGPLESAMAKTYGHESFRMQMTMKNGRTTTADISADGRERVTSSGMLMVVVPPTMYVKAGSGPWQKIPGFSRANTDAMLKTVLARRGDYTAVDLGMRPDGHAYRVTVRKTGHVQTVYLDGSGHIARVEGPDFNARFSNFGESLNIAPPI